MSISLATRGYIAPAVTGGFGGEFTEIEATLEQRIEIIALLGEFGSEVSMSCPTSFVSDQPCGSCEVTVVVYKARNRALRVTIQNEDITTISGAKLWFSVKDSIGDPDSEALISKKSANVTGGGDDQARVIDPDNKILEFYIVPVDTQNIIAADYIADAVIEFSDGNRCQLLKPFRIQIKQPATLTV
jgi:hypothetical protein